jgi:alpha-L-fucosidase
MKAAPRHDRREAWNGGGWKAVAEGRAIGHKGIDSFPGRPLPRPRLNILLLSAEAEIRDFQLFHLGRDRKAKP